MNNIIYKISENDEHRYALGVKGNSPLIFFGINPSTATPENYDQTMKKAKSFALLNNFDSWIMFNLYPQRAVNVNYVDNICNVFYHKENINIIRSLIPNNSTIVAAWGNLITKRTYFFNCLEDILKELKDKKLKWKHIGDLTKNGHPRHILYLGYEEKMSEFKINDYIKRIHSNVRT